MSVSPTRCYARSSARQLSSLKKKIVELENAAQQRDWVRRATWHLLKFTGKKLSSRFAPTVRPLLHTIPVGLDGGVPKESGRIKGFVATAQCRLLVALACRKDMQAIYGSAKNVDAPGTIRRGAIMKKKKQRKLVNKAKSDAMLSLIGELSCVFEALEQLWRPDDWDYTDRGDSDLVMFPGLLAEKGAAIVDKLDAIAKIRKLVAKSKSVKTPTRPKRGLAMVFSTCPSPLSLAAIFLPQCVISPY
jgi:hypothetical protein